MKKSMSLYLSVEPVQVLNERGVNISHIVNEFLTIHAFGSPKKLDNGNGSQPKPDQKLINKAFSYAQAKENYGERIANLLYCSSPRKAPLEPLLKVPPKIDD